MSTVERSDHGFEVSGVVARIGAVSGTSEWAIVLEGDGELYVVQTSSGRTIRKGGGTEHSLALTARGDRVSMYFSNDHVFSKSTTDSFVNHDLEALAPNRIGKRDVPVDL